jgi:transcriptional regulator with XRE-family HTH domain
MNETPHRELQRKEFEPFGCAECGDLVRLVTGPGRVEEYRRGVSLPVPAELAIPTCPSCGERYFDAAARDALTAHQAPLFAAWQREHCGPLIEQIRRRHRGITLRDLEKACGVSPTYLSHVLAGSKDASLTLIRLLEAFANAPAELERHLRPEPGLDAMRWPAPPAAYAQGHVRPVASRAGSGGAALLSLAGKELPARYVGPSLPPPSNDPQAA